MSNTVFVVVFANYGDQGVDFIGVYKTKQAAQQEIDKREPRKDTYHQQDYHISEEEIRDEV